MVVVVVHSFNPSTQEPAGRSLNLRSDGSIVSSRAARATVRPCYFNPVQEPGPVLKIQICQCKHHSTNPQFLALGILGNSTH